jgi:HlyD family secretion protein
VAADQASLDAADAQLNVARQNLAAATLVAPIAGTVAQVNITPGQQVTGSQGSSATASFLIEGPGGQEATTTVSGTDVGKIRVGQPATVTLDGSATSISGEVVSIGILSTSSSGTASYPVTIGLTGDAPTLFAGSDAQVTITLAKVSNVIAVPTSAVQAIGSITFVDVLRDGKPALARVTVGATGPTLTQVSSGLAVGDQVILANMSMPLPTNANPFAARGLTGGGGFGGGRGGGGAAGGGTGGGATRTGGGGPGG